MAALSAPRAFCAVCVDGVDGLRPRQLDEGGPVFVVCAKCDGGRIPDVDRNDHVPRVGRRRLPDDVISIVKIVACGDWMSAMEIADSLGIPGVSENRTARNTFSAVISRMHRSGLLKSRPGSRTGALQRSGHREYGLTEIGLAVRDGRAR